MKKTLFQLLFCLFCLPVYYYYIILCFEGERGGGMTGVKWHTRIPLVSRLNHGTGSYICCNQLMALYQYMITHQKKILISFQKPGVYLCGFNLNTVIHLIMSSFQLKQLALWSEGHLIPLRSYNEQANDLTFII